MDDIRGLEADFPIGDIVLAGGRQGRVQELVRLSPVLRVLVLVCHPDGTATCWGRAEITATRRTRKYLVGMNDRLSRRLSQYDEFDIHPRR